MIRSLVTVLVMLLAAAANAQQVPQADGDPWEGLAKKSAWVIVGLLDVETGQWTTLHSFAPGPGLTFDPDRLPAVGQTVVVAYERELVMPDFRFTGEERVADPPIDTRWERHLTGGRLQPGMRVIVYDVWKNPDVSNLQTVWARIGPAQPWAAPIVIAAMTLSGTIQAASGEGPDGEKGKLRRAWAADPCHTTKDSESPSITEGITIEAARRELRKK